MRPINLFAFQLFTKENYSNESAVANYFAQLARVSIEDIKCQDHQLRTLNMFLDLLSVQKVDILHLDNFYYQYKIPQISKEFDLLKVNCDSILNIEFKSELPKGGLKGIEKQLLQNKYYLKFLHKETLLFAFVESEKTFYKISDNKLVTSSIKELTAEIERMNNVVFNGDLDTMFKPTDYLVSPLNNPKEFLKREYFLTDRQSEIKKDIIRSFEKDFNFFAIKGKAGTGKTLLLYDLALEIAEKTGKKVLIIHCGVLAEGHDYLNKNVNSLNIVAIKDAGYGFPFNQYPYILLDEVHRVTYNSWNAMFQNLNINHRVVLCYDPDQILSYKEKNRDMSNEIEKLDKLKKYKLTEKIRTNKKLAGFIKKLIYLKDDVKEYDSQDVVVYFANDTSEAKTLWRYLEKQKYILINYTGSVLQGRTHQFDNFQTVYNSHRVIGQEFDNVVVLLNNYFYYTEEGFLTARPAPNPDYMYRQMLFQAITRTREKLCIIVIENKELFAQILDMMNQQK